MNNDAVIFVVDSSDRERIREARDELFNMMGEDELRDSVLLVFANKQDLPYAASSSELSGKLGLDELKNRDWFIQPTCAQNGEGLYEGLEWVANALKTKRKQGGGRR